MRDVVEQQAADGDVLEVVESGRGGSRAAECLAQFVVVRVVGERDVGQETAGFVLQRSQGEQVIDAVLERFDVPIEHRAVGRHAESMGFPVDREPLVAAQFAVGDGGARGGREDFRAAPRQRADSSILHGMQHLARRQAFDSGEMRDLDRGQGLDHDVGMPLLQAPEHVEVVRQLELGVQAADDVEFSRRVFARRVGLREDFLEAAGIRAVFLRHAGKRTKHAGVAQNADVGRIDVLVGGEVNALAVVPPIGEIGKTADREQVGRSKKRETILACQTLRSLDLFRDWAEFRISNVHVVSLRIADFGLRARSMPFSIRNPQSPIRNLTLLS